MSTTSPPNYHPGGGAGAPPPLLQSSPQQDTLGGNSSGYPGAGVPPQASYGNGTGSGTAEGASEFTPAAQGQPKRLHVSNIPFRFREPDLRQLFMVR